MIGARGERPVRRAPLLVIGLATMLVVSGCGVGPIPTPIPTPAPTLPASLAVDVVRAYVAAWISGQYETMYGLLAPADRARYPLATFVALHRQLHDLTRVTTLVATIGASRHVALPPEPEPLISQQPLSSATPGAGTPAGSTAASPPAASPRQAGVVQGPVPALAF